MVSQRRSDRIAFAVKTGSLFFSFARLNCYVSQHCLKKNSENRFSCKCKTLKQANKVLWEIYCQKNLVKVTKNFDSFVPNECQILQLKVQTFKSYESIKTRVSTTQTEIYNKSIKHKERQALQFNFITRFSDTISHLLSSFVPLLPQFTLELSLYLLHYK